MNNQEREALLQEIDDWTKYTPAGEYTTIRRVLTMLVDLAFPKTVEDWEEMIIDIKSAPKRSRKYLIKDSPMGENRLYEFIPGVGILVVASQLEEEEENFL